MNAAVYFEMAVIVFTAVVGGSIAYRLRRHFIVGYILGGVLIGLLVPRSPVMDMHTLETLAGIGAIMLVLWAGIEFCFRVVLEVKWVAIICGLLAILLSIALSLAAGHFLGWSPAQAVALGTAVSLSGTVVLSRLMADQGDIHSGTDRIMIGINQVQELGVVAVALLLPSLVHSDGAAGGTLNDVRMRFRSRSSAFGKGTLLRKCS